MKNRIESLLTRRPWLWILGCMLLTAFFLWRSLGLSIQEDLLDYWPEDDPNLVLLNQTLERFGLEGGAVLGLEFKDPVLKAANLERIQRWTESLESIDDVTEVLSLTNVNTVHGSSEGIEVAPLVTSPFSDKPEDLVETTRRVSKDPELAGRLLSDDARATALFISYPDGLSYAEELALGQALWDLVRSEEKQNPDVRFHPTGVPSFMWSFRV